MRFEQNGTSQVIAFGVTERLTIWLDGISLPDDVDERFSTDDLATQIETEIAFDASAAIRGSWRGPRETAIYVHGANAERLYQALEPVLVANPACQNARVIVRDGNPDSARGTAAETSARR